MKYVNTELGVDRATPNTTRYLSAPLRRTARGVMRIGLMMATLTLGACALEPDDPRAVPDDLNETMSTRAPQPTDEEVAGLKQALRTAIYDDTFDCWTFCDIACSLNPAGNVCYCEGQSYDCGDASVCLETEFE